MVNSHLTWDFILNTGLLCHVFSVEWGQRTFNGALKSPLMLKCTTFSAGLYVLQSVLWVKWASFHAVVAGSCVWRTENWLNCVVTDSCCQVIACLSACCWYLDEVSQPHVCVQGSRWTSLARASRRPLLPKQYNYNLTMWIYCNAL